MVIKMLNCTVIFSRTLKSFPLQMILLCNFAISLSSCTCLVCIELFGHFCNWCHHCVDFLCTCLLFVRHRVSSTSAVTYKWWLWRNESQQGDSSIKGWMGRYAVSTQQATDRGREDTKSSGRETTTAWAVSGTSKELVQYNLRTWRTVL